MAAGFRVRHITTSQSIGDRLKRIRTRKKISIAEAEEATKIRSKFLLALESDSWEQIPSEVYGRGYLERYAEFLQLPVDEVMGQYERQRQVYARHCQDAKIAFTPRNTVRMPRATLSTRSLTGTLAACAVIAFAGIILYQVARFTQAPYLQLVKPAQAAELDSTLVVHASSVNISGTTTAGDSVTVNGISTDVASNGTFTQPVSLQKGVNAVVVKATNAQGKTTSEVLSVVVR